MSVGVDDVRTEQMFTAEKTFLLLMLHHCCCVSKNVCFLSNVTVDVWLVLVTLTAFLVCGQNIFLFDYWRFLKPH